MSQARESQTNLTIARRLLWVYCGLWLLEGAIRKWVLPEYSLQLLLVRDPVVLLIYFFAAKAGVFPRNGWLGFLGIITSLICIQAFIQTSIGDLSPAVAVFGIRTYFLHVPLIWVVPALCGRREIVLLGKWILVIAPFLAVLMVVQFEVGQDHWLNAATLKGGTQLGSVEGKIRPAAVFSFNTGPICFFNLATVFALAGTFATEVFPRWFIGAGVISTLLAMSVSASRGMVVGIFIICAAGALAAVVTGKKIGSFVTAGVLIIVAVPVFLSIGVLNEGVAAFAQRWGSEDDMGTSGGAVLTRRVGGSFTSAFSWSERVPILGVGVGSTSNLAVSRSAVDSETEGEWERIIYEIGPVTGFAYLAFRALLAISFLRLGFGLLRSGNYFCFLFGTAAFSETMLGNMRQVTGLGYMCLCGGLCLASHRAFSGKTESDPVQHLSIMAVEKPRLRGRGRFAVGGKPVEP